MVALRPTSCVRESVRALYTRFYLRKVILRDNLNYVIVGSRQGQKDFAIILAKIRDTAIFNRLYIKLYIQLVANNGKNRDSVHAAISFCPWLAALN